MDLGSWLRSLGLERYEAVFRENAIDADLLHDLTEDHLREMGLPLGARLKLRKAISALVPSPEPISPAPPVAPLGALADAAERRQVTIMFSDLVDSTALAVRIDPEDLREIVSAYQKCVAETVQRYDGYVARYMGDGVLVYFGYPQAHEDDAERAVRAGLELVMAVAAVKSRAPVQTRIGIATGLVVVGELIGLGNAQERAIIGKTPNLAARLQGIAETNMVVICDSTRKLLGNLFALQDLGLRNLKGISDPTRAWAALRASSAEGRFEAMHATGLSALIGREEETELLLRRWSKAKTGKGQVVLLSGEAGIGKSRLAAALRESLGTEPHTCLRFFCSPQHADSAFYPIIGQLERAAGLTHDVAPHARLDKLDKLLAQSSTSPEDAALLAELLSLPNDGRYPSIDLAPHQRRQRTLDALTLQLQALARQNPVLMIFEDAHWTDPTSLDVFDQAVRRIVTLPVLLIVTFRPEFDPPWIGRPHVTILTINRLAEREVDAVIDCVAGNKFVPPNIRQEIIERSDGIPLFVEEMTKAVLEAESEDTTERTAALAPSQALAVPASLNASLMARLDRLGAAKEVAQIGAAIGREFSHDLLAAVAHQSEAQLGSALSLLVAAGLLFRHGVPPYASYLFKHALVQDTAYSTLLREPRRTLHARIADTIENQFAEISEQRPELLARHCAEAGLIEKSVDLWRKAGERSLERSALVEAAEQLTRALDLISALPATPARRREQIKLQVALITPLIPLRGHAAPETKAAAERARLLIEQVEALGEPLEDPLLLFSVRYAFWVANYVAFSGDVIRDLATQFLTLAEKQGATVPLMIGHRLMAISFASTGNIAEGRAHYDQALALYEPSEHRPLAMRFGQDAGVTVLCHRSWALFCLGYPEAAIADAENAIRYARDIGHAATLMHALAYASFIQIQCGNYPTANALVDELVALAEEKGALLWKATAMTHQGWLFARTGKPRDAVHTITSGLNAWRSTRATVWVPLYLSHLARAYADIGNFEDAWRCISEAIDAVETTKEKLWEAEIHRTAGEIALVSPEPNAAEAEASLARALRVARTQQAKSWELRAAMGMARLWGAQGKRDEAHRVLAPVYGWFTEGFGTLDLKDAKVLLDELAM
jgi:class 3 adenylate cyclase/predicted ATPase